MRAASMCSFLVEKGPNLGKKYDTKGLFLHSVATYFEEESDKCKSQLESLIKILCIRHGEKEKMDSAVHHLVSQFFTFFFFKMHNLTRLNFQSITLDNNIEK